jgi:microcystin-dependent protein
MATCLSNIKEIARTDCIGASRTDINDNFVNLKNAACAVDTSQIGIESQLIYLIPYGGIINLWGDITLGGLDFDLSGRGKVNTVLGRDLTGFALCNGGNGTPDLRDRFVVAAGAQYMQGERGPEYTSTASLTYSAVRLTVPELPIHTHLVSDSGHVHSVIDNVHDHTYVDKYNSTNQKGMGNKIFGWVAVPGFIAPTDDFVNDVNNPGAGQSSPNSNTIQKSTGSSSSKVTVNKATTNVDIVPKGDNEVHENRPPFFGLAYIMRVNLQC